MNLTKYLGVVLFALLPTFVNAQSTNGEAETIHIVYLTTGDFNTDASTLSSINGLIDSYNNNSDGDIYQLDIADSTSEANTIANDAYSNSGHDAFVFAHGVDDANPYIDNITSKDEGVVNADTTLEPNFKWDETYYCYEDGGGVITTQQAISDSSAVANGAE